MTPETILTYHKIHDTGNFERQVHYLKKTYPDALITVDDGDISFYENAFPLLKDSGLQVILFIITGLIDSEKPFWWDEVYYHLKGDRPDETISKLKSVPNQERLRLLETIRKNSDKPPLTCPQLTSNQLREMHDAGIIIGNHSHTHPMFDQVTEKEMQEELETSRLFFDQLGFGRYDLFAYPNGNFSTKSEKILKKEGIQQAFLFDHQLNRSENPLRISRLSVNDDTPMWKYRLILSGWHSRLLPVIKKVHSAIR